MVLVINLFDQCIVCQLWIWNQRKCDEYTNLVFIGMMEKNEVEEAEIISVTVLSLYITSYDYLFLEMLWMGPGVDMVVPMSL